MSWQASRTVGIAVPAPHSTTTSGAPASEASQDFNFCCWVSAWDEFQPQSPNMRILGLAMAPQRAHRPVDLVNLVRGKPGFLKVPIHIRGVDESTSAHAAHPATENGESLVRFGFAVEHQAVPIETPGQFGVAGKPAWVRQRHEIKPEPGIGGIGLPETAAPPEVG